MPSLLTQSQLEAALKSLPDWRCCENQNAIEKEFQFQSFVDAFSFMTAVALEAEKMDHHPDWTNIYSRVVVKLNTHSAGGLTQLDIDLAQKMEKLT